MRTLALEAHEARRASGESLEAVAARAGVTADGLRQLEAGGDVGREVAARVCGALSIPEAQVLSGMPHGWLTPVAAVDDAHAATLARLGTAAAGPGWVVASDVAAHDRAWEWTPRREAWLRARKVGVTAWSYAAFYSGLIGALTMLSGAVSAVMHAPVTLAGHPLLDPANGGRPLEVVGVGAALAAFAWLSHLALRQVRASWPVTVPGDASGPVDAPWRERADMLRHAYLVTAEGVGVLSSDGVRILRTDLPAATFERVDVTDAGADHVTVTVRHEGGGLAMRWIPRSRDLEAVTDAWRARTEARRTMPGVTYVVSDLASVPSRT